MLKNVPRINLFEKQMLHCYKLEFKLMLKSNHFFRCFVSSGVKQEKTSKSHFSVKRK